MKMEDLIAENKKLKTYSHYLENKLKQCHLQLSKCQCYEPKNDFENLLFLSQTTKKSEINHKSSWDVSAVSSKLQEGMVEQMKVMKV